MLGTATWKQMFRRDGGFGGGVMPSRSKPLSGHALPDRDGDFDARQSNLCTMSYDMGRTLTFRAADETLARLEKRARQVRVAKTVLAERYVAEGLAMDAFPGIVFRDGPAGRRPAVIGG